MINGVRDISENTDGVAFQALTIRAFESYIIQRMSSSTICWMIKCVDKKENIFLILYSFVGSIFTVVSLSSRKIYIYLSIFHEKNLLTNKETETKLQETKLHRTVFYSGPQNPPFSLQEECVFPLYFFTQATHTDELRARQSTETTHPYSASVVVLMSINY